MERQGERPVRPLEGVRVLVVDDEEDVAEIVATIVTTHGAQAESVFTVAEARDRLGRNCFDVVLSDVSMPGESGFDLLRSVRAGERSHALVVAAMTARLGPGDWKQMEAAGFDRVIAKPFGIAQLVAEVVELAKLRHRCPSCASDLSTGHAG